MTLRATQRLLSNTYKYKYWSAENVVNNNVVNPKQFPILSYTANLIASVDTVRNATIQSHLLDGGNPGGSLNFQDPWLTDSIDQKHGNSAINRGMSARFNSVAYASNNLGTSTTYKGVFGGLNPAPPTSAPNYYSLRAPLTQTNINGFTGYFQSWTSTNATLSQVGSNPSGYDQKAVVFTGNNATVTAKYKGHLVSSVNTATAYGGQRKFAADANGYHLVYESLGDVWYSCSTDGGATWTPDTMISAGNGTAHNPSISQPSSATAALYVFWVDRASSPNSGYSVYAKEYYHTYQQNQWYPAIEVGGVNQLLYRGYAKRFAKPSGVSMYDTGLKFLVAFEDTTQAFDVIDNNGSFYVIPNLSSNAADPAMFCSSPVSSRLYVAYDNGQNIYFSSSPTGATPSFNAPTIVSNQDYASPNTNPSISVDGAGRVQFAWQGFDHSHYYMNAVFQRCMWTSGYLQPINEFVSYYTTDQPSICGHTDANGGATLLVHDASNAIYRVTSADGTTWYQGGNYPGVYLASNCSYPNLLSRADPSSVPYILTRTNTAPYAISIGTRNENNGTGTAFFKETTNGKGGISFGQVVQMVDTAKGLNAVLTLSNIKVAVTDKRPFPAQVSTIDSVTFVGLQEGNSVTSGASFDAALNLDSCSSALSVSLALVDPKSYSPLMTLAVGSVSPSMQGTTSLFHADIPSSILATTPKLAVIVNGKVDTSAQLNLIKVFFLYDSSSSSSNVAQSAIAQLPVSYNLSQNYPNPFNPSTTINYSSPISSRVVLRVYDVLGREVRTLVDQYQAAGNYSAVFDASDLSSGVYFYRISAGKFTSVKKLVLVK